MKPTTIQFMGDYRDVLFYLFVIALVYVLYAFHQYFEYRQDIKANDKLFLSKEERDQKLKEKLQTK